MSGGLDSTVLLAHMLQQGAVVDALAVDYGQTHRRELAAAHDLAHALGAGQVDTVDMAAWGALTSSALTLDPAAVPQGVDPTHPAQLATVVPGRNMLLISVAASIAQTRQASRVYLAANRDDHAMYPDCRPQFIAAARRAVMASTGHAVTVLAPFERYSKAEVVRRGAELGVPFGSTWSCYVGEERHCGRCGACVTRQRAFTAAGVADPTTYAVEVAAQ
jgi:7-cyano-7-deazaguanine synthase